ncbi:hypothetical protein [Kitasatospora indigofera]|uniref:hypothetical protein n=1 Tax=Kitasatospora indigofera TaxID=67307 RepID=UPI0036939D80
MVIRYGWLAGVADLALIAGLVRNGVDPQAAALIGGAVLGIPLLLLKGLEAKLAKNGQPPTPDRPR